MNGNGYECDILNYLTKIDVALENMQTNAQVIRTLPENIERVQFPNGISHICCIFVSKRTRPIRLSRVTWIESAFLAHPQTNKQIVCENWLEKLLSFALGVKFNMSKRWQHYFQKSPEYINSHRNEIELRRCSCASCTIAIRIERIAGKHQQDKPILNVWIIWQKQYNHFAAEDGQGKEKN